MSDLAIVLATAGVLIALAVIIDALLPYGKATGGGRDRIRGIGQRVVSEHAEALKILAEHDPSDDRD